VVRFKYKAKGEKKMTIAEKIQNEIKNLNEKEIIEILDEECEAFSGGSWGQSIYEFADGSEIVLENAKTSVR
jgi:hypothetical protein